MIQFFKLLKKRLAATRTTTALENVTVFCCHAEPAGITSTSIIRHRYKNDSTDAGLFFLSENDPQLRIISREPEDTRSEPEANGESATMNDDPDSYSEKTANGFQSTVDNLAWRRVNDDLALCTTATNNCKDKTLNDSGCTKSFSFYTHSEYRTNNTFMNEKHSSIALATIKSFIIESLTKKWRSKFVAIALTIAGLFFVSAALGQATVMSDQDDYAPRSNAVFTGSGFAAFETVVLKVKNLNQPCHTVSADSSYLPWSVVADENGAFVSNWTVCDCPGDSLRLKAQGQTSGLIAYAYFTDANLNNFTIPAQSGTLTYGTAGTITYTFTVSVGSQSGNANIVMSVAGLPADISGYSFSPGSFTLAPSGSQSVTLTVTTLNSTNVPTSPTFTVTATGGGGSGSRSSNGTLAINKKTLNISATGVNKVYNGNTSATVTLGDDRVSGDVLTTSYTTATFANKNVGTTKTVNVSGISISGTDAGNYVFNTTTSTTANITALALTVTAATNTKTYNATSSAAAIPTITTGAVQTGDVANFTETYDDKNVGTGKTLTPAGTVTDGNGGNNYTYTFINNTTGVINARALTITAATNTKTYDGTINATAIPTVTPGGIQTGDVANFTEAYSNKNAGTGKTLTPSGTVTDGNSGNNYTYNFVNNTTGVINKLALTITAATNTKPYDGTTSATATPTMTSGVLQGSDVANFTETYSNKNAGTNKTLIPAGIVTDGNSGLNYSYSFVNNTTGVISAQALTITALTNTKMYDGNTTAAATPTITSGAVQTGDVAAFTETYSNKNAGSDKTLTPSGTVTDGNGGNNYTYIFVNVLTGVIIARDLIITGAATSKIYNAGTASSTNPTITGTIQTGDAAAFIQTYDTRHVGTNKVMTPSGVVNDGNSGNNYTYNFVTSSNGVITVRPLTITGAQSSKVYDGNTSSPSTPTVTGLQTGDVANFIQVYDNKNVGTGKILIPSGSVNDGNGGNNYTYTFNNLTTGPNRQITALPITVTADAKNKTYGDADPALTYVAVGLVGTEVLSGSLARVAGETVVGSPYAIQQGTVTNANNPNYNITYTGTNFTISQRPVTVTAIADQTKVYGNSDPLPFTYNITSGTLAFSDAFSGALTRDAGEDVGNYAITQGSLTLGSNYNLSFVSNDFSITQRLVTVTATPGQTKVYGNSDPLPFTYSITSGTLGFSDAFSGALTRDAGEDVGNYAITQGSLTLGSNYNLSFVSNDFSITQRSITITAAAGQTKVYGDSDPAAYTYSITSGTLAFSDAFSGTLTRDAGEDVGNYAITQGSLTLSSNYNLSFLSDDFIITQRAVTVTANAAQTKIYGNSDPLPFIYNITSGTLAFSDAFSGALTRDAGEDVGNYAITQGSLTLGSNYNLSFVSTDFSITQRSVTVTADAGQTKVYGDSDPAAYTYSITSGTLAFSDAFSGALTRDAGEDVGNYAITQGSLTLGSNYNLSFVSNDFSITQRPLTVTATAGQTKVYGNTDPVPFIYNITNGTLAFSDAFSGTLSRDAGEDVGNYAIIQGSLTLGSNYNLSFVSNDFSITQRSVIVTADAGQTKVYGDSDPAAYTYSITSGTLAFSDAFSGTLTRDAGEDVGNYAITQGSLTLGSNYNLSFVSNDFIITQRPVTVTANAAQTKVYGNSDPLPFTYNITSGTLAFSDAFSGALTRDAGEDVGNYAITQGSLTLGSNYNLSFVSTDFSITQRSVTVTADAGQTKVYGDSDPAAYTYSITSGTLAFSDAFSGALTRDAGEDVGNYAITQGSLTLGSNYNLSFVSNDFSITQRPLTVTATAGQTKIYGNSDPLPFIYNITSGTLAFSDAFSGALTRDAGEDVGNYAITQGSLTLGSNYNLSFVSNDFSITQRPLTVTATAGQTKVYGDSDPAAYTYSITSGTLAFSDAFSGTLTRDAGEDVGNYAITQGSLTLSSNYNLSFLSDDFIITQRAVMVTANAAQTKVYGNSDPLPFTYNIMSGTLGFSDAFSGALTRDAGEDVGNYAITQGSLTLGSNYNLSFVSTDFSITQRPVTVTADAGQTKVYGNSDPLAFIYNISSGTLAFTDAFSGVLSRVSGENVGLYAITQGSLTLGSNYNLSFVSNDFSITQRPVAVTATAGQTKVFGNGDPLPFTYSITSGTLAFADTFSGVLSRVSGENVGLYAITQASLTLGSNYNLSFVSNDFSITQRPVTVTATAGQTKVYGNSDPLPFTYSISSGTLAFTDAFSGVLSRVNGENVGLYAITVGSLTLGSNYNLSFVSSNFSITQRPVTITATAGQTKIYGNSDPLPFTYSITSGTLGFSDAFSGVLSRVNGENVGLYAITVGSLTLGSNYNLSFVSNNFSITQRPVMVTANAGQTKVYGNGDPLPFTYSITSGSLAFTDAFSGVLSRVNGENVGLYAITQGSLTLGSNYSLSFVSNNFSITQRPVTVTATAGQTKVYGNGDPLLFTYSITSGTLGFSDAFSGVLSRVSGENVGLYAITKASLTLGSNYNLSFVSKDFSITQRPVTVTAIAGIKVYGVANPVSYTFTSSPAVGSSLPNGHVISFTGAQIRAAGENVGSYAITQGSLNNTNYNISYTSANFTITQRPISVTVNSGQTKIHGMLDPTFTYTVGGSGLASFDEFSGALTRVSGENVGTYAISQGTLAIRNNTAPNASAIGNYSVTFSGANFMITQASTITTLVASAQSVRYMDNLTMTAEIKPQTTGSPLTGSVEFFIGSINYGTAAVVPIPGSPDGSVKGMMIKQVKNLPANYTVNAVFTSANSNYTGSPNTKPLTVVTRTASPYASTGLYTGDGFAWTTGPNSSTATLTMVAAIKDANSPTGDVRGAKVSFYFVNGTTMTPISSAQDLPVGLIDVTDGSAGTASAIVQLNIGSLNSNSFQIAIKVTGAYTNNPWDALSQTIVTVAKPIAGGFICGGSSLKNVNSSGYIKGATDLNTDFQFDIQYNNSGTNPKGKVNILVRSWYNKAGILDSKLHTYLIRTNAISLLAISNPLATGTFSAKANMEEQLDDGTVVSVESGATFQMVAFQNGCDQQISITYYRKAGGVWFSSKWNAASAKTDLQAVNAGSKVYVSTGGNCTTSSSVTNRSSSVAEVEQPAEITSFHITAYPNPAYNYFTLHVQGNRNEKVQLKVFDIRGRVVHVTEGSANQNYRFGEKFTGGVYIAEVIQGDKRKTVKLIKQQ